MPALLVLQIAAHCALSMGPTHLKMLSMSSFGRRCCGCDAIFESDDGGRDVVDEVEVVQLEGREWKLHFPERR